MAKPLKKETTPLLMPKASAVWLIENTALTFRQIAEFTDLTEIEIEALANEDIGKGIVGRNPVEHGELVKEELERCENDPEGALKIAKRDLPSVQTRSKGPRYTPVSKRGDKPDATAYILKHHPEISDAQICKLVGTTKPTIASIRERTHPNTPNLKPRHPAELGLCSYTEFEAAYRKGLKAAGKDPDAPMPTPYKVEEESTEKEDEGKSTSGGFDFSINRL